MSISLLSGLMYAASVRTKSKKEAAKAQAQADAQNTETHWGFYTDPESNDKTFKSYRLDDPLYPKTGFKVQKVQVGSAAPFDVDYPQQDKPQFSELLYDPHYSDFVTRDKINKRQYGELSVDPESWTHVGNVSLTGQISMFSDEYLQANLPEGTFKNKITPSESTKTFYVDPSNPTTEYTAEQWTKNPSLQKVTPYIYNRITKIDANGKKTVSSVITNLKDVEASLTPKVGQNTRFMYKGNFYSLKDLPAEKDRDDDVFMVEVETADGQIVTEDGSNTPKIIGKPQKYFSPEKIEPVTNEEFTVRGKKFTDMYSAIVYAKQIRGRLKGVNADDDVKIFSQLVTTKTIGNKTVRIASGETKTHSLNNLETQKDPIKTTLFRGFNADGESKIANSEAELKKLKFDNEIQKLSNVTVDMQGEPISIGDITMMPKDAPSDTEKSYVAVQKIENNKPNGNTEYVLLKDVIDAPDTYEIQDNNIFTITASEDGTTNKVEVSSSAELDSVATSLKNVEEADEFGSPIVFENILENGVAKQFKLQTKDSKAGTTTNRARYSLLLSDPAVVAEINSEANESMREKMLSGMMTEALDYINGLDNPEGSTGNNFSRQLEGSDLIKNLLPNFAKIDGFLDRYDEAMGLKEQELKNDVKLNTSLNVDIPNSSIVDTIMTRIDKDTTVPVPVHLPNKYHDIYKTFMNDNSGVWGDANNAADIKVRQEAVASHIVYKKDPRTQKIIKIEGEDGKKYSVPADDQPFLDMYNTLSNTLEAGTNRSQLELLSKFLVNPVLPERQKLNINEDMKAEIGEMLASASNGNAKQAISFIKTFMPRLGGNTVYKKMLMKLDGETMRVAGINTRMVDEVKKNHIARADSAATAIQTLQEMIQTYFDSEGKFIPMNSWQAQLYLNAKGALTLASQTIGVPEGIMGMLSLDNSKDMIASFDKAVGEFTSLLDDPNANLSDAQRANLEAAREYNIGVKNKIIRKLSSATDEKDKRLARREYFKYMLAYQMAAAIQGGTGGRTISDQDVQNILRAFNFGIFKSAKTEVASLEAALQMMTTIEAFARAKGQGGLEGAAAYRAEELLKNYGFALNKPLTSEMIAQAIREEGSELASGNNTSVPKTLNDVLPKQKSAIIKNLKRNLKADGIYNGKVDDTLSDDDLIKKYQNVYDALISSLTT